MHKPCPYTWTAVDDFQRLRTRSLKHLAIEAENSISRAQVEIRMRPELTLSLLGGFVSRTNGLGEANYKKNVSSLRVFFAFLDSLEQGGHEPFLSLESLSTDIPDQFRSYLLSSTLKQPDGILRDVSLIIMHGQQIAEIPTMLWGVIRRAPSPRVRPDVGSEAVLAFRKYCVSVVKKGRTAAEAGIIRVSLPSPGSLTATAPPSYILEFERRYQYAACDNRWGSGKDSARLSKARHRLFAGAVMAARQKRLGTKWEGQSTYHKLLGATLLEAAAARTIVAIDTGWTDALGMIDTTASWIGESDCDEDRSGTLVLQSERSKTGRLVHSVMGDTPSSSVRTIRRMMERNEWLVDLIDEEIRLIGSNQTRKARDRLHHLTKARTSPFAYFESAGPGYIDGRHKGLRKLRLRAVEAIGKKDPAIASEVEELTPGDFRHHFAERLYQQSGGNIFVVQRALGHKCSSTTINYLRSHTEVAERFRIFSAVTEVALDEVSNHRGLDARVLLARCFKGGIENIPEDLREILKAPRSTIGAHCKDPRNPPSAIDPDHDEGALCSTHRCTLCKNGYFFAEEVGVFQSVSMRYAMLIALRCEIGPDNWNESIYSLELSSIEALRDRFYPDRISEFNGSAGHIVLEEV